MVDPETNEVSDQKVMALLSGGGYADFAKVHKDHLIKIPESMSPRLKMYKAHHRISS